MSTKPHDWTGYPQGHECNTYDALMACDLPTAWLQRIALQCYTHDNGRPMWRDVASSLEDARDYYATLADDPDEARSEAALVLGAYGWTRAAICHVYS